MKHIFLIFLAISFSACSTSITRISDKVYQASCPKFFGDCEAEIAKTCPTGHRVTSNDWSYGPGGAKDKIYFECTDN